MQRRVSIVLDVRQKHIDRATHGEPEWCPIAWALRDHEIMKEQKLDPYVWPGQVQLRDRNGMVVWSSRPYAYVNRYIQDYDHGRGIKPDTLTFELKQVSGNFGRRLVSEEE